MVPPRKIFAGYNWRVTEITAWAPTTAIPALEDAAVQVWRLDLGIEPTIEARLRALLTDDERSRADRFYFPHLRTHFTAARAALRILLGTHTGQAPESIRFAYAQHGKPYLPETELEFNLSHSGGIGLIALVRSRRVGVDVEQIRDLPDGEAVARRYFAPAEVEEFLACNSNERMAAFFNGWTRKEAFIKAIGDGLTCPLDSFRVSLRPGKPARLLEIYTDPDSVANWQLADLAPGPGYAGALMVEGPVHSVQTFAFDPGQFTGPVFTP